MEKNLTIEAYPETEITPILDQKIRTYLRKIFPVWDDVFKYKRTWHDAAPVMTYLAWDGLEIAGHIAVVERTITTEWNWRYRAASFQGVSVNVGYRGHRLSLQLLNQALDDFRNLEYPFAILYCVEKLVPFYRKQGWMLPNDSMVMWKEHSLSIAMHSNCPMYQELGTISFPEGPIDVHNPIR